ncbi:hypothetical protein XENOCAPTIV_026346, partial [Xenoophorus captivus]
QCNKKRNLELLTHRPGPGVSYSISKFVYKPTSNKVIGVHFRLKKPAYFKNYYYRLFMSAVLRSVRGNVDGRADSIQTRTATSQKEGLTSCTGPSK